MTSEADLHEQALEWLVIFWSGEVTARQKREWQQWLESSAAHAQAWHQVQTMQSKLQGLPSALAVQALRASPKSAKRRKLLQTMGLVLASGVAAHAAKDTTLVQSYLAEYRTAAGEQRQFTLADGTRIRLNTASAMDIQFDAQQRRILLHSGEIFIQTAPDSQPIHRPFIVETQHGTARALGTQFNVRQLGDQTRVAVFEGAVEILASQHMQPLRLDAGQQASYSKSVISTVTIADTQAHAWVDGQLVVERMRLVDFLVEVSRYRAGIIRCDDEVAGLMVSGVYPLHDTDLILQSVGQAMSLRVAYATRYWVTVSALPAGV